MNKNTLVNCLILGGSMLILGAAGGSDAEIISLNEIIIYLLCGFILLFVADALLINDRKSKN